MQAISVDTVLAAVLARLSAPSGGSLRPVSQLAATR
jgi:hypothetical protein